MPDPFLAILCKCIWISCIHSTQMGIWSYEWWSYTFHLNEEKKFL